MAFTFDKVTYEKRLENLIEAVDWLLKIGIDISGTRFEEIVHYMEIITDYHRRNDFERLLQNYDGLSLYYSVTESSAFAEIYDAFRDMKDHELPRLKLREMLKGPLLPMEEDPSQHNIHGRNTLFELEIAAKVKRAGIELVGFDDVDFQFAGKMFNAQCKRIHSQKRVRENIEKAVEQLSRKMREVQDIKGLICLSIDKLTGKEGWLLRARNVEAISPRMASVVNSFIRSYCTLWQRIVNLDVLGVLVFFKSLAVVEEEPHGLLTSCTEMAVDIIPRREFFQQTDYNLMLELGKRFNVDNVELL